MLDRLREALEKALHLLSQESRAKPGKRRPRKKPGKAGRVNKFKNAPGSACGTGAGGFKAGNNCQKEDGIPNLPKSFSQGGKSAKAASLPATKEALAAKAGILKQATKQAKIRAARKKAAIRKKEKDAKAAEENKARAEAAAKKRAEMLKVIRKKKANEKLQIVGDKSVDVNQIKVNKANQGIKVVGTPKSLAQEIAEAKAAAAAKTAEKGKPAPYKKPDTPPPPDPPASTPNPKDLTKIKTLGGSTGATLAKDAAGNEYVIKGGKSAAHIKSESDADELYRAAGVNVPKQQVHDTPDGPQKVAEFIKGKTLDELKTSNPKQYEAAVKRLRKDFVVDALLGNRDVVGMKLDNIVVGKGGKVFRVDNGGSLTFRAQGATKDFGPDVSKELNGLRDSSINPSAASVFGGITNKEVSSQITALMKKKEAILAAAKTPELRAALEKRFDSLLKWQKDFKTPAGKVKQPAVVKAKPPATHDSSSGKIFDSTAADWENIELHPAYPQNIPKNAPKSVQQAIAARQTHAGMTWKERKEVGKGLEKDLSPGEKAAFEKWTQSPDSIHQMVESPESFSSAKIRDLWKKHLDNFRTGVQKLPLFVGGPTHRGMSGIPPEQLRKWIESKAFTNARKEGKPGVFASFSTRYEKAWGFSSGSEGVIVTVVKSKRSRDGAGLLGLDDTKSPERELISMDDARYKVKGVHLIWGKKSSHAASQSLGFKKGQTLTLDEYNAALKKAGSLTRHKSIVDAHSNDSNVRVGLVVEELGPTPKAKAPKKKKA